MARRLIIPSINVRVHWSGIARFDADNRRDDRDDDADRDDEDTPETPPDEPRPPRVEDPPPHPDEEGPYVVHARAIPPRTVEGNR